MALGKLGLNISHCSGGFPIALYELIQQLVTKVNTVILNINASSISLSLSHTHTRVYTCAFRVTIYLLVFQTLTLLNLFLTKTIQTINYTLGYYNCQMVLSCDCHVIHYNLL